MGCIECLYFIIEKVEICRKQCKNKSNQKEIGLMLIIVVCKTKVINL